MSTLIQLFIGILSCLAFVLMTRPAGPRREVIIYAAALMAAALIYVGFAVVGGAAPLWIATEAGGLALFSLVALIGLRYGVTALALGWASHAVWDVALHGAPGFVPEWYPTVCLGFDLFLSVYILSQARRWRGGRRPHAGIRDAGREES